MKEEFLKIALFLYFCLCSAGFSLAVASGDCSPVAARGLLIVAVSHCCGSRALGHTL